MKRSAYCVRMNKWNVSPKEAILIQRQLAARVELTPLLEDPALIAGCDVSMNRFAADGYAGFITLSYPDLMPGAVSVVKERIPFPYIPGLLSFREIPMLLNAWEKLPERPELIVVDGIGIAHPRRFGIASHLGVLLNVPTIGCAKSVLIGEYEEPAEDVGAMSPLIDPKTTEVIGAALRTKPAVKPVFISPGHLITLSDAIGIMRRCFGKYRIPEPTRLAHEAVNAARRNGL